MLAIVLAKLAVDGGNTKTIALVAALDGTILGAGRGGCSDIYNSRPGAKWPDSAAAAIVNIEFAVESALQAARIKASDLVAGVFNMAGADWPEDFALLRASMEARGYGHRILVQNDALGVLHAGSSDNTGVSVVCGTGGATGARGPDGRTWHSSRWQDQVQGSVDMAQKALDAFYRSEIGIEPSTTLKPRFLDFFQLDTVEEILHLFTSRSERPHINLGYLTLFAFTGSVNVCFSFFRHSKTCAVFFAFQRYILWKPISIAQRESMQKSVEDEQRNENDMDIMLYDRYAPSVLAYIYQQVPSPQDAEDVLVEVFMAALNQQNFSGFSPERQLAWLRRVARNKVIDLYRRDMHFILVPIEQAIELDANELTPEQRFIQREKYDALYGALEQLAPVQQQIIHLRFGNGLRVTQIADILNKPEKTVSKFLYRTLRQLRTFYEKQEGGKNR
jgi:RNA polymerase sigma factor (sigma-70 family)